MTISLSLVDGEGQRETAAGEGETPAPGPVWAMQVSYINDICARTGWSVSELARRAGLSPSTLNKKLAGAEVGELRLATLLRLAEASSIAIPQALFGHPAPAERDDDLEAGGPSRPIGRKPRQPGSLKEATSLAIGQVGGARRAMRLLGLSETRTYALADPDEPDLISRERLELLSQEGATAFAERLALLAGGVFLPLPKLACGPGLQLMTAEAMADFGAMAGKLVAALADGRLDRREARDVSPLLAEALRGIAALNAEVIRRAQGE